MNGEITVKRLDWERLNLLEAEYIGYRAAVEALHRREVKDFLREAITEIILELRRQ